MFDTMGISLSGLDNGLYFRETVGFDPRLPPEGTVLIRSMAELRTKLAVLIRDVYFEGGDVLRCYEGRFGFRLQGRDAIEIEAGDSIVIYPGQRVTIEALGRKNLLRYAIFTGEGVVKYFDGFGFFNGIHGKTSEQRETFEFIRASLGYASVFSKGELLTRMSDALTTFAQDFSDNGNAFVIRAIRQIKTNLANRIVRLDPLCEQLKVSHTYLHRMFTRAGIRSPSEFIRREQLLLAMRLLKDSDLSVGEISKIAGFISSNHFANFIKRYTGHTANFYRN